MASSTEENPNLFVHNANNGASCREITQNNNWVILIDS